MSSNAPFSIDGKRSLIVGGTAGIGLGVAGHFVQAGADVIITGRRADGKSIAEQIGARFVAMDLAVPESITAGIRSAAELFGGGIDCLILNAGIADDAGTAAALDLAVFRRVFEINVFGVAQALRDGVALMDQGGSVIVTSSPAATELMPGVAGYGASKAAVNVLVRTAAIELGPRGIRVNAVLPGVIETEMSLDPEGPAEELERLSALTATGKVRQPAELGPPFQFLASAASATCTGALLACEDGVTAGFSTGLLKRAFGSGN